MFLLCRNKVCKVNSEDIVFNSGTHRKKLPVTRSEEHTSELQSLRHLVCRLLLEKKNTIRLAMKPPKITVRDPAERYGNGQSANKQAVTADTAHVPPKHAPSRNSAPITRVRRTQR